MDEKKQNPEGNLAPDKLMLLITVVQKGKGTFFADFLKSFDANLQIAIVGTGTAETNLVEFLGLKDSRRSIIFSIVREERINEIMEALEERFHTVNNDRGISFAMPLSSVIGKLSYGFLSNDQRMVSKNG
ncbi:MAG: hypothetical protein IJ252_12150 [Solobacterium sp.]|nr:hypothetical protein [Solobacterium sp.]